jgi:tetratricopeptide (TPR) repeat protein
MILRILEKVNWKRPVYFAVTVARDNLLGLERYLRMDGLAYKVVPFTRRADIKPEILSENLLNKFKFRNLNNPDVYYNDDTINLLQNYRSAFIQLTYAYLSEDKKEKAKNILETMSRVLPAKVIPYTHKALALRAAELYRRVDLEPEAEQQLLHFREDVKISDVDKAINRSQTAQGLKDWDTAEAILLEMYNSYPNNPDIIMELIRVYELSKQYDKEIDLLQEVIQRYPNATVLQERLKAVRQLQSEN